jgi:hypothetical protein
VTSEFNNLFEDNDGNNKHLADIEEDYNYMVDSLEDEHVRRTVHTTKTHEDKKLANEQMAKNAKSNSKFNNIENLPKINNSIKKLHRSRSRSNSKQKEKSNKHQN